MMKHSEQVLKTKLTEVVNSRTLSYPLLIVIEQYIIQHIIKSAIQLTIKSSEKVLK